MSTTPPKVLQLARQGQPNAIAALMNQHLESKGITAYVAQQGNLLQVVLEASGVPAQSKLVNYVKMGISGLGLTTVDHLSVSGKQQGSTDSAWTEMVQMREGAPPPTDILGTELDGLDFDAVDNALDIDDDFNLDLPDLDLGLADEATNNDLNFDVDLLENAPVDLDFGAAKTTNTTNDAEPAIFNGGSNLDLGIESTEDSGFDLDLGSEPTEDIGFDLDLTESGEESVVEEGAFSLDLGEAPLTEEMGVDSELEALAPMDLGSLDLEEDLWGDPGTTEESESSAFATPDVAEPEFSLDNTSFETEALGEDAFELPDLNEEALTEELPFGTTGFEEEALGVDSSFEVTDLNEEDLTEESPFGETGFEAEDLGEEGSFEIPDFGEELLAEESPFSETGFEAEDLGEEGSFEIPDFGEELLTEESPFGTTGFEEESLGVDSSFEVPDFGEEALTEESPFGVTGFENDVLDADNSFALPNFEDDLPGETSLFGLVDTEDAVVADTGWSEALGDVPETADRGDWADVSEEVPQEEADLAGLGLAAAGLTTTTWDAEPEEQAARPLEPDTEALTDDMEPLDSEAVDAPEEEFSLESPLAEETFEGSLEPEEELAPIAWNEEDLTSGAKGNGESALGGAALGGAALGGAALGGDNTNGFHQDEATDDADDADDFIHKFAPVSPEEVDQCTPGKAGARSSLKLIVALGAGTLALLLAVFGVTTLLGQMRQPDGPVTPPLMETPISPDDGTAPPTEPPGSPNPFRDAVNAATQASQLTQTASTKEEWQAVADGWQQAMTLMQQVPASDPNYAIAQDRAVGYQPNLAYAQQKVQQFP